MLGLYLLISPVEATFVVTRPVTAVVKDVFGLEVVEVVEPDGAGDVKEELGDGEFAF
jgi:hypothetical protein